MKKKITYIIRCSVCLMLLWYVLTKYEPKLIIENLTSIGLRDLIIGLILFYAGIMISSFKWASVLKCFDPDVSRLRLFRIYLESDFYNLFFPGFIAGDVSRAIRSSANKRLSFESAISVFFERFSGFLFISFFTAIVALTGGYKSIGIIWEYIILTLSVMIILSLIVLVNINLANHIFKLFPSYISNVLEKITTKIQFATNLVRENPIIIVRVFGWTVLFYFTIICAAFFISRSVQFQVPFYILLLYVPLVSLVSSMPISIAGIGVRENINVVFYSTLGFAPDVIVAFGLAISGLTILIKISGGIVVVFNSFILRKRNR